LTDSIDRFWIEHNIGDRHRALRRVVVSGSGRSLCILLPGVLARSDLLQRFERRLKARRQL
jgi:hypothetical protein